MKLVRRCLAMAAFLAVMLQMGSAYAVIPPQSLLAVSFSDPLHGYVAGGYTGSDGVLSYTADGGATWMPSQQTGYWARAVGASFDGSSATASSDYVDTLISTTDAGVSWSPETPVFGGTNRHIYDVAYLNGGRVAVGQELGTALNGNIGVIARKAGGGSWTRVFSGPLYPPPDDETPAPLTYAQLTSVDAAAGGMVAWAVGAEFNDAQQLSVMRSLVYRTADGGSTWTTDAPSPAIMQDVTAVTAATVDVAFATTQMSGTGPGTRTLLRRLSGTWGQLSNTLPASFQANALDAFDADHLVVVGNAGKIAYTANASAATPAWTSLSAGTNDLYGVQMLGPNSWIVVGGNETLVRFVDGAAVAPGSYAPTAPTVTITSPTPNFGLPLAGLISGTSSDTGVGVLRVEVQIQRDGGAFWNGLSWGADPTWLRATGTSSWSCAFDPGVAVPTTLTVTARATDGMNLNTLSAVGSLGTVLPDLTPPTTTSDALATYPITGGTITLTATDNAGGSGVASTHWGIGTASSFTTGTSVPVPTTVGSYTLYFYSVDVAGNTEDTKTADFQVSDVTPPVTLLPVYRFRNLKYGTHFYTASQAEYTDVFNNKKAELTYEGVSYKVAPKDSAGTVPVHRFLSKKYAYVHFYTASDAEYQNALNNLKADWQYEGVGYAVWAAPAGTLIPVHRFLNLAYGVHFYTAAQSEYNTAIGMPIYKLEGIGFYVEPTVAP